MANSYFQFKQFLIHQDRCAMKLGTDAVMLGALAHHPYPKKILDIGMGTGVIGLMLAQRFSIALVHGVEIEEEAFLQAKQNIQESPWKKRMEVFQGSFQEFSKENVMKYDLVVSNPPYFSNHLKSDNPKRNWALHDEQLSLRDLLDGVKLVLRGQGVFWVILPIKEMQLFKEMTLISELSLQHQYLIRDQPHIAPYREICAFGKGDFNYKVFSEINLKEESGEYSRTYKELVKNFLLHF